MKVISMAHFSHSINMIRIAPLSEFAEDLGRANVSVTTGSDGPFPVITLKDMNVENPSALLDVVHKLQSSRKARAILGDTLVMSRVQIDTLEQKTFLISLRLRSRGSVNAVNVEDIALRAAGSCEPRERSYGWRERDRRTVPDRRSSTTSPVDDMAIFLGRIVSDIQNETSWAIDVYDPIGPVQELFAYLCRDTRNPCRIPVAVYDADGSTTLDSFTISVTDQTMWLRLGDVECSMAVRTDACEFLTIISETLRSYLAEGRDIVVLRSAT